MKNSQSPSFISALKYRTLTHFCDKRGAPENETVKFQSHVGQTMPSSWSGVFSRFQLRKRLIDSNASDRKTTGLDTEPNTLKQAIKNNYLVI